MQTRRLTLQLTPLLDLMLIVLFAQYMDVQIVAKNEADRLANERQTTEAENESLRKQVEEWESQRQTAEHNAQRERDQLGQLVRELFKVPDAVLNKIIQPRSKNEGGGLSPAEIAELKAQFQQMAAATGEKIVDHLLTFNEMQKQFDIWQIYMTEDGELLINAGQDRQSVKSKEIDSPETFIDAVLQIRKRVPPTKDTVLILCRYGDCRLSHRLSMIRGLPAVAERLKAEGQGTTKFEYAVFGYRPQPELETR
jgi:hypothetical protein